MRTKFMVQYPEAEMSGGGAPEGLLVENAPPPPAAPPGAPPTMQEAPKADWNTENWKDFLDEDLRTDPSLKHIKDIPSAIKSYVHAQKMIGQDKILVPNKFATPDEWNSIYAKLGRPEAPDKYEIKAPEGSLIAPEFLKGLKESAFKAGLNTQQANEFVNFYDGQVKAAKAKVEEYETQQITQDIGALKKEWGAAYDSKIKAARVAIESFGGNEMKEYLKESGLDTDTKLARFFAKIGESLAEDNNAGGEGTTHALTPAAAEKELNSIMSNPAYFDKDHPDHNRLIDYAVELRNWKKI